MRALWLENDTLRVVEDVPTPASPPGEARIRVRLAGICNTDLEMVKGYYPFIGVPGYEFVAVILDELEKQRFQRRAAQSGVSLSAWLREAGREKLASEEAKRPMTLAELRAFFAECDAREKGREPSWEEHLAVMEHSRARGRSGA